MHHQRHRLGVARDLVEHGVGEIALDQAINGAVERGREEQRLAFRVRLVEDAPDGREEAHVRHAVGFVDHHSLDTVENQGALLHQVFQPTGTGNQNLHALAERALLGLVPDAAVDREDTLAPNIGERLELTHDLRGEFTGRSENQRTRTARARRPHPLDDRRTERDRLARSGRGASTDVLARERIRDGCGLHRKRCGDASRNQRGDKIGREPKIGKAGHF